MIHIRVSIVVPVYNEERRLSPFLQNLLNFASEHLEDYEILIIDDGSSDGTEALVKRLISGREDAKLLGYSPNRGKGAAVQLGIMNSRGERVLFIDGDGSIQPNSIPKMLEKLEEFDVVVGDRSLGESKIKIPFFRYWSGRAFNFIVNVLFGAGMKDNLCGFKGFRAEVAKDLFGSLISQRWAFDVELFYKIMEGGYSLYRMPLDWEHKEDSKMTLLAPFRILLDLIVLRVKVGRGNL